MNTNVHSNHSTADLTKLRTELIPQIADYNCLRVAEIPAERVCLGELSDSDFREQALEYLNFSIEYAEERLEELRQKKAVFVGEPAGDAVNYSHVFRALAPVLISAIQSGSDQGNKVAGILWSLYADDIKVGLRESLEELDAPTAEAVASLITAYASVGARAKPLVGHILRLSKAEVPSRA